MTLFEYRTVGNTNFRIPVLGFGSAFISGSPLSKVTAKEAVKIINHAYDSGIRYFDTAPLYGTGKSEYRLSKSILPTLDRKEFLLSTKVGRILTPDNFNRDIDFEDNNYIASNSWTEKDVIKSVEQSLIRLNLDSIDILYVHDPDMENYGEDQANKFAFPTLLKMKKEGLVKAIGCGMNEWEMAFRFIKKFDLDIILLAGRYTLLEQNAISDFLPLCQEKQVSVVIGGPYNSGILASDLSKSVTYDYLPAPEHLIDKAKAIKLICNEHSVDIKAAALQFPLAHSSVVSVIPGVTSIDQVNENITMLKTDIPNSLWEHLKATELIHPDAPTPN